MNPPDRRPLPPRPPTRPQARSGPPKPPSPRAEAAFISALDRPPPERDAFVTAACAGDESMDAEVRAMLALHGKAGQLLDETPVSPEVEEQMARLKPEEGGEMIGPYKLREQIGEGGFGTVWVADQEKPVRRRVALKIIKLGMDTKEVIARFEQERQALAMMDHPNIAKVLDAGATQYGRPYFVMELVRGVKITEYCDDQQLSTSERIELFITVCQAVQHAHQKGIIHRDLKPSNILVTINDGRAVPKVIDFGVAKATQGRLTDQTVYTQFQQMIGTPLYMSPEQAELTSLDIDTRSDIYALGVLLYELLTGHTPIEHDTLARVGMDEIRRIIREVDPPRPSMRMKTLDGAEMTTAAKRRHTEPAKLSGALRGDLDWIVMKCIEKDRARRYDTANGLAMDLQRHLANEVVVARPPTTAYLLSKLVKRNRSAVAGGSMVVLTLIIGFAVAVWQAGRANHEAARSAAALDELRATAPAFAEQARSLVARERFDDAIEKLNYAIKLRPDVAEFLVAKGDVLQCQLRFLDAAASYREALRVKPGLTRAEVSAKLCEELLAAPLGADGKLSRASLGKLHLAMQQQQRPAAELLPVARLLGQEQTLLVAAWLERLKDLPISAEKPLKDRLTVRNDSLLELDLKGTQVADLTPLAGMPLGKLVLWDCKQISDLTPLREFHSLTYLDLDSTQVTDLSPLRGLPLEELWLNGTKVTDLSALRGMKLKTLGLWVVSVYDLSPLANMPLTDFSASMIPATDLSPLRGAPLENFSLGHSQVRDLSFLAGAPLKGLYLYGSDAVRGLSLLANFKTLERLVLSKSYRNLPDEELAALGALRTHPTLKWIQADPGEGDSARWQMERATQPKEVFWQDWDREQAFLPAIRSGGLKFTLAKLPDGTYSLAIGNQPLSDLSFLKGTPISELHLPGCKVADLSPLRGLPLKTLWLTDNPVADLSPLRDLPLQTLSLRGAQFSDLSPLIGMPLKELYLGGCGNVTDVSPLAKIATLEKVTVPTQAENIEALRALPLQMLAFDLTPTSPRVPVLTATAFWETWPTLGWLRALNQAKVHPEILRQLANGTWEIDFHGAPISDLSVLRGAPISILKFGGTSVADLGPLRGMPLKQLYMYSTRVTDLRPLEGMQLESLHVSNTGISDISVLRGMPLKLLRLHSCDRLTDLSPIADSKGLVSLTLPPKAKNYEFLRDFPALERLDFTETAKNARPDRTKDEFWKDYDERGWERRLRESGLPFKTLKQLADLTWQVDLSESPIDDLEILRGARISDLNVGKTKVADLSPLRKMPLTRLVLNDTLVADLSPLEGMAIEQLYLGRTKVRDLSWLHDMPLKKLQMRLCNEITDVSPLVDLKTLKVLILPPNAQKIEALQALLNLEQIGYNDAPEARGASRRAADQFWKDYSQLARVRAIPGSEGRLKQLSDGSWELNLDHLPISDLKALAGTPITNLHCAETAVTDLEPLRGLPLQSLTISNTKVRDLNPLVGMPLNDLRINKTLVADISVLRGMPLTTLRLHDCANLTDLTPISKSTGLTSLTLPPEPRDIAFLETFPKLERLGYTAVTLDNAKSWVPDKTVKEFWKEYKAKKK